MARKERQRVISYYRAIFPVEIGSTITLQSVLERCLAQFAHIDDTRMGVKEEEKEIRHRRVNNDGIFLHIVSWTGGETISTVPHVASIPEADLSSQQPGPGWDYLNSDGMLFVSGNHVLALPSDMTARQMSNYISKLIEKCREHEVNLPKESVNFQFVQIADPQAVDRVRREGGIKRVKLHLSQYLETVRGREESGHVVGEIARNIVAALAVKDEHRKRFEEAENINAQLILSCDGRRSGLTIEEFSDMIEAPIVETPEDIEFETKSGRKVKRGSLVLSKTVRIEAFDKTVGHSHAWAEMREYFKELQKSGDVEL